MMAKFYKNKLLVSLIFVPRFTGCGCEKVEKMHFSGFDLACLQNKKAREIKYCICIATDKVYVGIVTCQVSRIYNRLRHKAFG